MTATVIVECFSKFSTFGTIEVPASGLALGIASFIASFDEGECTTKIEGVEKPFPATPEEEEAVAMAFEGVVGEYTVLDFEPEFTPEPFVEGEYLTREEEAELLEELEELEGE